MSNAPSPEELVARVARTFDTVADDYDQSGVPFFGPIAARLLHHVDPRPGEAVLDVGCGRGAVTLPAARAVGATGRVTAVDVSPAMVEHTRAAVAGEGLGHVEVRVGDASALDVEAASYDVVTSSLVLFFLPQPAAALPGWLRALRSGGRLGVTTFGAQGDVWREVDALFAPHLPPALLDPRTRGADSPFASDAGVERLLREAGGRDVRSVREPVSVVFEDAAHWRAWTMGTGQRMFWGFVPEPEREPLFERAAAVLEQARDGDRIVLHQEVRHTLATA